MTGNRREFIRKTVAATSMTVLPVRWSLAQDSSRSLPRRPIPGTSESLPVIGLGNSNAFRQNDVQTSTALIKLFHEHGGAYVDCSGGSRFVVAEVARSLGISEDLFLGTYFSGDDEAVIHREIEKLRSITGKSQLDLAHSYTEFAEPNWDMFRRWKEEGLTRHIGVARHQSRYHDSMIRMMTTGTLDFLQVNYSLFEPEAGDRVLPMALDKDVAVTINRPFINGEYFSRLRGHELPPWAQEFDCDSWAQFSLKFILSNPAVTCVLTETANPKHALDNISAGFGRLPDEKTRQRMLEYVRDLPA